MESCSLYSVTCYISLYVLIMPCYILASVILHLNIRFLLSFIHINTYFRKCFQQLQKECKKVLFDKGYLYINNKLFGIYKLLK